MSLRYYEYNIPPPPVPSGTGRAASRRLPVCSDFRVPTPPPRDREHRETPAPPAPRGVKFEKPSRAVFFPVSLARNSRMLLT